MTDSPRPEYNQEDIQRAAVAVQDNLFEQQIIRVNKHFKFQPLRIKADITDFMERTVAYSRQKANIGGLTLQVEISFMKNKCFITCVDLKANQFQILEIWKK